MIARSGRGVAVVTGAARGIGRAVALADADWHDQIDVDLTGTANVLRLAAPLLVRRGREHGGGRIIVTSSTQGQHGTVNGSAYSASKRR